MKKVQMSHIVLYCLFLTSLEQPAMAHNSLPDRLVQILQDESCPDPYEFRCRALENAIITVWKKLQAQSSPHERAELRLELNHALEVRRAISYGAQEPQLAQFDQKYKALRETLAFTNRFSSARGPDIAYHHLEMAAVQDVMNRFGQLELNPKNISPKDKPAWQSLEVNPPWAGYWYPRYDSVLYSSDQSVFAKVDRMMQRIGRESKSRELEASLNEGHPESWEGLCNAWSNASIMEAEPRFSVQVLGETLSISDQKALFTKLYEGLPVTLYGIRYDGDHLTDGTYQDIRPEALHRIALSVLGNMKKPFIIDDTAGSEVWQQPVFRVDWAIQEDASFDNAYQVAMRLWKIKMRSKVDDEMTSRNDYSFDSFEYRLFVDPELKSREGRLLVIAGEWIGNSRKNHPDYVVMPADGGRPSTFNTWLQNNLDPILALLRQPPRSIRPD